MEVRNCDWETGTESQLEPKYCRAALVWQPRLRVVLMWPRGTATATPPPKPAGAVFALKNMGWSERQEVESKGSLASIDLTRLSDEQLERIATGEHPLPVLGAVVNGPSDSNHRVRSAAVLPSASRPINTLWICRPPPITRTI